MVGNRGRANQALYEAHILLDSWPVAAQRADWPDDVVARAFRPAILLHLRRCYGWFLLAVAGLDDQSDPRALPPTAAAVPAPPAGRAPAPELREFALLEASGWLREMLDWEEAPLQPQAPTAGLLGSDRRSPGQGQLEDWYRQLSSTMARMDDSLNEC